MFALPAGLVLGDVTMPARANPPWQDFRSPIDAKLEGFELVTLEIGLVPDSRVGPWWLKDDRLACTTARGRFCREARGCLAGRTRDLG